MSKQNETGKERPRLAAVMARVLAKRGGTKLEAEAGSLASLVHDHNVQSGRTDDAEMKKSANLDALRAAVDRVKKSRA